MKIKIGKGKSTNRKFIPIGQLSINLETHAGTIDFRKLGKHLAKQMGIVDGEIDFLSVNFKYTSRTEVK